MLLNKVLFVSLLVLGLCILQPALGDRLATRIAGGTQANTGQFPFVALIQYPYTVNGVTFTYQATGAIYDTQIVITSATALQLCASGTVGIIYQGISDLTAPDAGNVAIPFACNVGSSIFVATGFTAGVYTNDFAYINLQTTGLQFPKGSVLRTPSSSPTAADIGNLFFAGYGESVAGGQPSPILQFVQMNPQRNRLCAERSSQISSLFSFANNFCGSGFIHDPDTGYTTDACVLDAGGPLFRTSDIGASYADHEVVGILNFATCTDSTPAIFSYLWRYLPTALGGNGFLPAQVNQPIAGNPANPRASDGNFACGDGVIQPGALEKCDSSLIGSCCDHWTCQFVPATTACTANNKNGTRCRQQPRCNKAGKCRVKNRRQGKSCNGANTKCNKGKCCTYPGATSCFI